MEVQHKTGKRRQYTADFKHEAVRLVIEPGLSMAQVASDPSLDDNLVIRLLCQIGRTPEPQTTA